jgi:integrase
MIGVPNLTMYYARYSWATYASKIGVDESVIGKALGHTDVSLAGSRYISFDWSRVDDANRKVIDYTIK